MSLDKTLFKALRAGGLGHKAALLLANQSGRYGLGKLSGYTGYIHGQDYLNLNISLGAFDKVADEYRSGADWGIRAFGGVLPLAAGGSIKVATLQKLGDAAETIPDGSLEVSLVKVADANGTPIAPASNFFSTALANGAQTRPANAGVWTLTQGGGPYAVVFTTSTAGHYLVTAELWKAQPA